jgi:hypothetical protein
MKRSIAMLCAALLILSLIAADDKSKTSDTKGKAIEDSPLVKKSREKLASNVTVDFKDEPLKGCFTEFKNQTGLSFQLDTGVSGNQAFTYSAKDKPLKDAIDEMFKGRGLGYIIGRKAKEGDRYEGWLIIVQGDERGDPIVKGATKPESKPPGSAAKPKPTDPKPADPKPTEPANEAEQNEKLAQSKLKTAKIFLEDGKQEDAKDYCEQILKKWPKTKAAEEAKKLMEKLKK